MTDYFGENELWLGDDDAPGMGCPVCGVSVNSPHLAWCDVIAEPFPEDDERDDPKTDREEFGY